MHNIGGIMRKIMLFFIVSTFNFSCMFLSDPDFFMRKAFETVKEVNLEKNLYCDRDGKYMVYYYGNNPYLQVGLIEKPQKNEKYTEVLERLQENSSIIYDVFMQKVKMSRKDGNFVGMEFRHYLDIDGNTFMMNKLIVGADGDIRILYNNSLREIFKNSNEIYYTEDIKY